MTDWKAEFSRDFDKYVMHGKFREENFTDAVVSSDKTYKTNHGAEIMTEWICKRGFRKGVGNYTEDIADLFLFRLSMAMQESICGEFLHAEPDRAREIYIDCLMHIENTDEEMEG